MLNQVVRAAQMSLKPDMYPPGESQGFTVWNFLLLRLDWQINCENAILQ